MEAFLISTGVVALAEIGDKTQLLALLFAARFQRPVPIILGILLATLANHTLAGLAGHFVGGLLEGPWLRWVLGGSFLAVAAWTLIPDKIEKTKEPAGLRYGVFAATLVGFFLVEIGDKTQVATVALAAKFAALPAVVAGTTLGMMLANVPAVLLGSWAASRVRWTWVRYAAAAAFAAMGALVLLGVRLEF